MKATDSTAVFIPVFMHFPMKLDRRKASRAHSMGSAPVTVCLDHEIYAYGVTESIAGRGGTKGQGCEFKMSDIRNGHGGLEVLIFSRANTAGRKIAEKNCRIDKRHCICRK